MMTYDFGHLRIIFREMSVGIMCLVFNWVICHFAMSCKIPLYVLGTDHLVVVVV